MKITAEFIRSLDPCYDPSEIGFTDDLKLTPLEFIEKFKDRVKNKKDVIWLLCRNEFMSDKDLRLFAVWCAREAFKLVENVDQRSIDAVNIAERFANGDATEEELKAARSAVYSAAHNAAEAAQIEQLKTYFKTK